MITILVVLLVPWYYIKTALAVLIPACMVTVLIGWQYFRQPSRESLNYLVIFILFDLVALITLPTFHSMLFYCVMTGLMMALFVQQARELNQQKAEREIEQQLMIKLQFKLDQNEQQQSPAKITINSAGKTELIHTNLIVFCQAAGDYVDINLLDNKSHLYSGSMKSLESQLPNTFIRVHRSYIVNLDYVDSLKSSSNDSTAASGGGHLVLNNLREVPVSRRLMPQVRQAIKQGKHAPIG